MTREVAILTLADLQAATRILDTRPGKIQSACPEAEFHQIRRNVGRAFGEFFEIKEAIYFEHPNLVPPQEQDSWNKRMESLKKRRESLGLSGSGDSSSKRGE